jgi:uncharacterized protein
MLENSFQHIPGIGAKTELKLWSLGFHEWESLQHSMDQKPPLKRLETVCGLLHESKRNLLMGDIKYFENRLPARLHWRFFPEFRDKAVYLDIETDGLESGYGCITSITLYDGKNISCYINGQNLNDFIQDIQNYDMIISYNGKCFDIPYIENFFNITIHHAHIDLRFVLGGLGYKGGLKACESSLGLNRGDLADLDGFFAVLLWQDYKQNGNQKALETLLAYNIEDTVNLERLMVTAYNLNLKKTGFYDTKRIDLPEFPSRPFKVDLATIEKIRRQYDVSLYSRSGYYF